MNIPRYLYDAFPGLSKNFKEIEVYLLALEKNKLNEVHPKPNNTILPKTVFRLLVYNQIVLHRVIGLSQRILQAWGNKNAPTAFTLLRTLDEYTSVVFDANLRLETLIAKQDFNGIHKLIFNLTYGTRIKDRIKKAVKSELKMEKPDEMHEIAEKELEEAYTAQQILDVMDRITKRFPDHRMTYEFLCEYAHPNYDGLMGLFGQWKDKFTIEISEANGITDLNVSRFFEVFAFFLKIFVEGYDGILEKFNSIIELSNEELRKQGKDTTGYEKMIMPSDKK